MFDILAGSGQNYNMNAFQKVFLKMDQKRLDRAKLSTRFGAAAAKR